MLTLLFLLTLQAPAGGQDLPPIRNFLQVTPEFCTGGQPRLEHFAKLKADGVKAVLNLRRPSEHRADEEKTTVEAAGLKYFNIPVDYQNPKATDVDEFLKITDDAANRPMFIHCTAAIRVGGFWMIRRVLRDGMTFDAALEEARKIGLTQAPHLEEFAREYIRSHKRGPEPARADGVQPGAAGPARASDPSTSSGLSRVASRGERGWGPASIEK
jgi:uncharacterized protein (TIGR01244 family)